MIFTVILLEVDVVPLHIERCLFVGGLQQLVIEWLG